MAIGISAIVFTFVLYSKIRHYLFDGELKNDIVITVLRSSRIKQEYKRQGPENRPIPAKVELSTENFNFVVDTVIQTIENNWSKRQAMKPAVPHVDNTQAIGIQKEPAADSSTRDVTNKYASAYDVKRNTFYKVEDRPSDETIYELTFGADIEGSCSFTIYRHAYKKVTEVKDFLDGACHVAGSGSTIQIKKTGTLTYESGKWSVEQPLEVVFI